MKFIFRLKSTFQLWARPCDAIRRGGVDKSYDSWWGEGVRVTWCPKSFFSANLLAVVTLSGTILLPAPRTIKDCSHPPSHVKGVLLIRLNMFIKVLELIIYITLDRESIAYPYMDFKNPRISIWISIVFGCQSSILHTSVDVHILITKQGYPCKDILQWMSVEHEYLRMDDIHSFYGYQSSIIHAFINIHLDIHWFLWMSMHGLAMDSRSLRTVTRGRGI